MDYKLVLTTLIQAIQAVEILMPESTGKEKFDAAMVMVTAIIGNVEAITPALVAIATLLVNGFRAAGIFKKKEVPAK